ncbi:UDP-N-acetylglucosamine 2-epimerase [Selenomonas ruminis]|uniref:UDP-N-acetylglucosamine 2-epimerase (Hydrolyzing) n=1 Tax=Selenomonas ruminis TaxID=2593411 RepID=A0A5D6WBW5_9FIRM|nr:UDP-N-acetylglucosamine 2-epimerase [Selenomonas sp. mPRGC5]TYZ24515.1 UDP-N-acetylglucosamine 2-epimerase (hydrolyzing) [Selenomonas sp. mPRGC5]
MKKIAIVTATRAEYGLLAPIITELRKYENDILTVELIVTGTHLSQQYGMTVQEIEKSGQRIDKRIEIPLDSSTALDISSNQAATLVKFTRLFAIECYQAVVLLGDRYEMLMVSIAAGNTQTPVFHLCGGDTTEGAMDEWIRHAITKISYLHFVTNEESRRRVIQLGEDPARVFNVGSTSIDNILTVVDMSKAEALKSVGVDMCDYALATYHPVTMEADDVAKQVKDFLAALQAFPQMQFIVTKSNADQGGARINALLDAADLPNVHVFTSLGVRRYLSLMKYAKFVLGNSSSGIIEAPALHVPTVNIGNRQRGRYQSASIINCGAAAEEIMQAMEVAMSEEHQQICKQVVSPYGDGHAAEKIAREVVTVISSPIDLKKKFYDWPEV